MSDFLLLSTKHRTSRIMQPDIMWSSQLDPVDFKPFPVLYMNMVQLRWMFVSKTHVHVFKLNEFDSPSMQAPNRQIESNSLAMLSTMWCYHPTSYRTWHPTVVVDAINRPRMWWELKIPCGNESEETECNQFWCGSWTMGRIFWQQREGRKTIYLRYK